MNKLPSQQNGSTHLSEAHAGHREWIGGRILTLLSHYWREDDPVELTEAIGADWAEVLEGLPQSAIAEACTQYLREETFKPKPADIYKRALRIMPKPKLVKKPVEPTERGSRVTLEQVNAIREEKGFPPLPGYNQKRELE